MYQLAAATGSPETVRLGGQPERALTEARRTRELVPGYDSGAFLEGQILYTLGRWKEADALLEGLRVAWAPHGPACVRALVRIRRGDGRGGRRTHPVP